MRLLVTGSNGLLGQKILEQLQGKSNITLVATGRGENRCISQNGYEYHDIELTDFNEISKFFEDVKPDTIIHTAAVTNVDFCEDNKAVCDELNIEVTKKLWDLSKTLKTFMLHLSTDFIFDGKKGDLYTENDKPNPLSYYGLSKLKSEQIFTKSHNNHWAIARTILVYGIVNKMSRSNIALWAVDALKSGKDLNVVNDQFRSPTLADDLALGCLQLVEKRAKGIFNLSGPEYLSVYDFVKKVADVFELSTQKLHETTSELLKQPANRPPKTGFNISKARKTFDYHPKNVTQGLSELKKQIASNIYS